MGPFSQGGMLVRKALDCSKGEGFLVPDQCRASTLCPVSRLAVWNEMGSPGMQWLCMR